MPKYKITGPDGKTYVVSAPDGASQDDVLAYVQGQVGMDLHVGPDDTRGSKSYTQPDGTVISAQGQVVYDPKTDPTQSLDPTSGMSGPEKYAAGTKAKLVEYAMGAQQLVPGLPDNTQEIIDKQRLDAPLMATGAGQAGGITGALLPMMATGGIPGINTYRGAAALGGAMGAIEPTTNGAIGKAENALMGAGAGVTGQLGGNTLAALLRGGKSLVAPLFESGRNEAADYIIQQQAADPLKALQAAQSYQSATPGVVPTLAEATLDPGISALQRGSGGNDVASRHLSNRRAIVDALRDMGGTPEDMQNALAVRSTMTGPAYKSSMNEAVPGNDALSELMRRPSMQASVGRALHLAKEGGLNIIEGEHIPARAQIIPGEGEPSWLSSSRSYNNANTEPYIPGSTQEIPEEFKNYSGQGLQYMKMSLDDIANPPMGQGMSAHEMAALKGTRAKFGDWLDESIPQYGGANRMYRALSEPINQMEIARELYNRVLPALSEDAGSVSRMTPQRFAQALREGSDKLVESATGRPGQLEDVMRPDQMRTLEGISSDLGREQAAYDAAMIRGSPTSRNLVTQNLVDQVGGSFGGPRTKALISAITRYPLRAVDLFTEPLSQEINAKIAQKLSDSSLGLKSLQYQPQATRTNQIAEMLRRMTPALTLGALGAYGSQK